MKSQTKSADPIQFGLERCLVEPPAAMQHGTFGLLMNQASVDSDFHFSSDVLAERFPAQLVALFSPQHGLWGEQQANMIESPHSVYQPLGLPIYSLYSETRRPLSKWLDNLDCLVVDLQDVGTRVYTFAWTVSLCLEACAEAGIPLVVLDRPNPLGGVFEGPQLESGWETFVGRVTIPMRHGLSLGELTRIVNRELEIGADLDVVSMRDWDRRSMWPATGRAWLPPSPNLPRVESTLVYPGQVLLEGTNLSEGRGTTRPFELVGAPFIDPFRLADAMAEMGLPGVRCLPTRFRPTFDKWQDHECGGVSLHVLDTLAFQPVRTTVALLACIGRLWPDQLAWLPPPYEYEREKMPIDILFGSDRLRLQIESGSLQDANGVAALVDFDGDAWRNRIADCLLYD